MIVFKGEDILVTGIIREFSRCVYILSSLGSRFEDIALFYCIIVR